MSLSNLRRGTRSHILKTAFSVATIALSSIGLFNTVAGIGEQSRDYAAAQTCIQNDGDCSRDQTRTLARSYEGSQREANGLTLVAMGGALSVLGRKFMI